MRIALIALCLIGCIEADHGDDPYYDDYNTGGGSGWGSGWGGTGGSYEYGCKVDTDCGSGLVCARTRECLNASVVRVVRTIWTVGDAAASDASCSSAPKLAITFSNYNGEQWGFSPVPCDAGKFTVDKFPTRFTTVTLSRDNEYSGGASGTFDAAGTATLDLPY